MADAFKEFEHQRWEEAVSQYDASFSRVTQQTITRLLEVLGVGAKTRFLDVACGPGYLTAEAARLGATAIGIDFSAAMIELARRRHSGPSFFVGDAEDLAPVPDAAFDAAGMNFGILHLSNPEKALREMQRVLVVGGRVAFTIWRPPQEALGFGLVLRALEKHGDPNLPMMPRGPGFFQYSEPRECESILDRCGFSQHVETLDLKWRLTDAEELFLAFYHGTARTGGLLRQQQPAHLDRIREELREAALSFAQGGELVIPMPAQLAWGVKR